MQARELSVEPSNGTDAVRVSGSAMGDYGWVLVGSVSRPAPCFTSAWSCHSRTASAPMSSAAAWADRGWNVSGRTAGTSSHRFWHGTNDCS